LRKVLLTICATGENGQQTGKGLTHMDVKVGFLAPRYIPGAAALDRLVLLLR
jgi:hypothetical protein